VSQRAKQRRLARRRDPELLDLDSKEAAELLNVRPVTVRVLASQGRAAFKRELETSGE
jgi:DNA-directed RNA polymerase specialized sigma24 family protein